MSYCTYRWNDPDVPDPGPCQCQRQADHDGAHKCCCGNTERRFIGA